MVRTPLSTLVPVLLPFFDRLAEEPYLTVSKPSFLDDFLEQMDMIRPEHPLILVISPIRASRADATGIAGGRH